MSTNDERRAPLPLAESIQPDWRGDRREQSLLRVHARLERRARLRRVAGVVGVVAVLGLLLGFFGHERWGKGYAVASRDAQRVMFGDGSTVHLQGPSAALDVGAASPSAVEVSLRAGSAEFEITPNPARRFIVHAGVVDVSVLGTIFRVTREAPRVHVEVSRGRVEVRFAGGARVLTAGESNWFPPEEAAPPSETRARTGEPVNVAGAPSPPVASASANTNANASSDGTGQRKRFMEHAARGEYREAYSVLEHAPEVVQNTPEDLLLAADAARFSNHPAQATRFLERLTREHPQDSVAPLAAFTLGRIYLSQLGQPAKAADAFSLSLRLAPSGSLAEDALAREVEAAELAGQLGRAHDLAEQYVRRYPHGRRLPSVQKAGGLTPAP